MVTVRSQPRRRRATAARARPERPRAEDDVELLLDGQRPEVLHGDWRAEQVGVGAVAQRRSASWRRSQAASTSPRRLRQLLGAAKDAVDQPRRRGRRAAAGSSRRARRAQNVFSEIARVSRRSAASRLVMRKPDSVKNDDHGRGSRPRPDPAAWTTKIASRARARSPSMPGWYANRSAVPGVSCPAVVAGSRGRDASVTSSAMSPSPPAARRPRAASPAPRGPPGSIPRSVAPHSGGPPAGSRHRHPAARPVSGTYRAVGSLGLVRTDLTSGGSTTMAGSVILAGARTPIGKLSRGARRRSAATDLGGFAIKAALERAGRRPRPGRLRVHGPGAAGRRRPDHGPPGGGQGRHPDDRARHDRQQGVPVGPQRDLPGRPDDPGRRRRHRRRRRHGVDDQGARTCCPAPAPATASATRRSSTR